MLLDSVDVELLRLTGAYGLLYPREFKRYDFAGAYEGSMQQLLASNILEYCGANHAKTYLRISANGTVLLAGYGYRFERYVGQSLKEHDIRRVIETSSVALLCRRAGIDVTQENCSALIGQPTFVSSKSMRRELHNSVSSAAQCVGFGHWGDVAYLVYYATEAGYGPFFQHENTLIHRLSPMYGQGFGMPFSVALCGNSYGELYRLLKLPPPPQKRRTGQITYAQAYQKTRRAFHLLACTETGATQLALMCRPGYREQIAKLILGSRWSPPPPNLAGIDGMDGEVPFVVAIDMDLRRVTGLYETAWARGYPSVKIAALTEQVDEVLARLLPVEGIELLYFEPKDLAESFGGIVYAPQHQELVSPNGRSLLV